MKRLFNRPIGVVRGCLFSLLDDRSLGFVSPHTTQCCAAEPENSRLSLKGERTVRGETPFCSRFACHPFVDVPSVSSGANRLRALWASSGTLTPSPLVFFATRFAALVLYPDCFAQTRGSLVTTTGTASNSNNIEQFPPRARQHNGNATRQVLHSLAGGFLFGVQFESHRRGDGGSCGAGGAGATQKRKRGCGDSMDTEAVQTTLEAMRIQVRFFVF